MKQCTDHLGKVHGSVKAMCAEYGIAYDVFNSRRMRGWTLEDALTVPLDKKTIKRNKPRPGKKAVKKEAEFVLKSKNPSVEYRRYLEHKLSCLNGMATPYIWADQIHELHKKISAVDSMSYWLKVMDDYLNGRKQDERTKEQIEGVLDNPESIFEDVLDFDREMNVSGYFNKGVPAKPAKIPAEVGDN